MEDVAQDVGAEMSGRSIGTERPKLYRNNGDGSFTSVEKEAGIDRSFYAMGCNYGDLNNDGLPDFYVGTGAPSFKALVPNRMMLNKNGNAFEEVTGQGGFGHLQKGHGIGFADLDGDGDQDVYAVMGGAFEGDGFMNALFENPGFGNNWIALKLEGVTANKSAIGARIKINTKESNGTSRSIYSVVSTGGSFGANTLTREIGLRKAVSISSVEITWPGESCAFANCNRH